MGNNSFLLSSRTTKEFNLLLHVFCYVGNVLILLTFFGKLKLLWELIYFKILLETEYA